MRYRILGIAWDWRYLDFRYKHRVWHSIARFLRNRALRTMI